MWINPAIESHADGVGRRNSLELRRRKTWTSLNHRDRTFYEVASTTKKAVSHLRRLQDNGSWCGPSQTLTPR